MLDSGPSVMPLVFHLLVLGNIIVPVTSFVGSFVVVPEVDLFLKFSPLPLRFLSGLTLQTLMSYYCLVVLSVCDIFLLLC